MAVGDRHRLWPGARRRRPGRPAAAARRFAAGRPLAAACLAVAGPVVNGVAELTNAGWTIAEDEVAAALGCPALIVNDFVGAARGVTALGPDGFTHLHGPAPQRGLIGVLGAGTGLGQALLSPVGESDWQVWPSQGGHVDLAPTDDESLELLRFFMERHPEHVSAERALSGEGLLALQAFYRSRGLAGDTLTDPAQVSASGDDASRAAIRRFCQLLGAAAGIYRVNGVAVEVIPGEDPVVLDLPPAPTGRRRR